MEGGDARHTEVMRLLVEGGADPNIPDGEGVTPLKYVHANGYDEMVGMLEKAGGRRMRTARLEDLQQR